MNCTINSNRVKFSSKNRFRSTYLVCRTTLRTAFQWVTTRVPSSQWRTTVKKPAAQTAHAGITQPAFPYLLWTTNARVLPPSAVKTAKSQSTFASEDHAKTTESAALTSPGLPAIVLWASPEPPASKVLHAPTTKDTLSDLFKFSRNRT